MAKVIKCSNCEQKKLKHWQDQKYGLWMRAMNHTIKKNPVIVRCTVCSAESKAGE